MNRAEAAKLAEVLLALRDDPVLFVETVLGATPQRWQAEALRSIVEHDRLAIRSGHGVGKTTFLAWVILWWVLTHYPSKVACTANTASQLSDVLWSELGRWHRKLPDGMRELVEVTSDQVRLVGAPDCYAVARTSRKEQPEALQGFHSDNMLFVIDEASGVPDIIFEVAQGALSTVGAKIVMTGNPTRASGYFYDAFTKFSDRWRTMKVSCFESDRVSADYPGEVAEKYGDESNVYRVRVLGEFPSADDDVLVPRHLIEDAKKRDIEPTLVPPIWGVDVARFGDDRSALAKRQGNVLLEPIKTWRQIETMELVGRVFNEYRSTPWNLRPRAIYVDVIGIGAGVVDRLRELDELKSVDIVGVNVSELPSVSGQGMRLRDELYLRLKEWFESREVKIPDDEALVDELTSISYKYLSTGKFQVESKDQMRKRIGKSPDVVEALLMTFADHGALAHKGPDRVSAWRRPLNQDMRWVV